MIKNVILIVIISISTNLKAQKLLNSKELNDNIAFYGYSPQIININATEFLMVQRKKEQIDLVKYDHELNEKGTIQIKDHNIKTQFTHIEGKNQIISFEFLTDGKRRNKNYSIVSSLYDIKELKVLNKVILLEEDEKFHDVITSKNGHFFALVHIPEEKYDNPVEFTIYNSSSASKLGTIQYQLPKRADIDGINLSNSGKLIFATLNVESQLFFNLYDNTGELLKTIEKESKVEGKEYFDDIIFQDNGDYATIGISYAYDNYELSRLQTFEINFTKENIEAIHHVVLDKDFVKDNLYQNVYESYDDKWGDTAPIGEEGKNPKKLKGYQFTKMYRTGSGNIIYQLEEKQYKEITRTSGPSTRLYTVEDLLLIGFDNDGKFKFSTVIDKKASIHYNYSNPFTPAYSGLETTSHINNNKLNLISKEPTGFASFCMIHREVDLSNGKITKMAPLFEDCDQNFINNNYTRWISPSKLVTVKMKGTGFVLNNNEFNLQIVEF
ncbi:hypothetical protein SAMN05661096_03372 [Marivirga sericea]|uniref:Uncharacterized protein n=1 Tax=Marivirga sericea TaxID=1028 RepID=A0A1X7L0W7_9BACT|nr:hypothetical protein [Marivirga sericea]SMG47330.1 hypothetical protein SAMN05661096_03372 [Marivirga sericea]